MSYIPSPVDSSAVVVEKKESRWRHPIAVALLTAALTVIGTNLTLLRSASLQRELEQEKLAWQKDLEKDRIAKVKVDATFAASVELANRIAAADYEVGSFLRSAIRYPNSMPELFAKHESRMGELMPPVVSAHTAVTAHDRSLFDRFKPLIAEINEADSCATKIYERLSGPGRAVAFQGLIAALDSIQLQLPERVYSIASEGKLTFNFTIPCDPPKTESAK